MYFVLSLFAVVVGAILKYAVADNISGVDLSQIGVILMVAGIVGAVIAGIAEMFNRRHDVRRDIVGPDGSVHSERQQGRL